MNVCARSDSEYDCVLILSETCRTYSMIVGVPMIMSPPKKALRFIFSRFLDDNQILTSSGDMSCVLWDIETGQQVRIIINVQLHFMIDDIFNIFLDIETGQQVCTGCFFNCSSQFSVPKWKTMGSQSEILFHEILDVQKIHVGWTTFFFLALKFGRNS